MRFTTKLDAGKGSKNQNIASECRVGTVGNSMVGWWFTTEERCWLRSMLAMLRVEYHVKNVIVTSLQRRHLRVKNGN